MAENFLATRVILAVGLVLVVIVAFVLARRSRRGAAVIAIASGLLVLALTFSPDLKSLQGHAVCNLTPYAFAFDGLNMALFLLPALFAVVATRRPLIVALAVPVTSALIELVQFLSPALGRRCDIDDWLANVIGGLVGVVIGVIALRFARARSDRVSSTAP
jgi:hypothetical protein